MRWREGDVLGELLPQGLLTEAQQVIVYPVTSVLLLLLFNKLCDVMALFSALCIFP